MLAMTPVIADYTFKMFLTLYFTSGATKRRGVRVINYPYSSSRRDWVR